MRLQLYVLRTVATRVLGAILVLMAILQILDLLEVTTDILDRGLGVGGVFYYAALRAPRLFEQVAPLGVLAGGLFAFSQLARENAVVAMRASGVSGYRIVLMAVPVAIAVLSLDALCGQVISPRTDPTLSAWWAATTPVADRKAPVPRTFRAGEDLVTAKESVSDGAELRDLTIYRRDKTGALTERVAAPVASYRNGAWRLEKPVTTRFMGDRVEPMIAASATWPTALRPADVQALFADAPAPSAASARRALENGGSDRPQSFYATRLQTAFSGPLAALVMLLLSAPVAWANFRSGQGAVLLTTGLAAGLVYLVADGLLSALGESGSLSPILAAWSAPAVFAALAVRTFVSLEG
ncbi:LptF/LptG family permease [Caulobacter hibisci]|uniref:LptF/LptG family permease n=1 Tax=Caulobacter hibisci TaxID=2035993 RepID=A0ABS0SW28_9CAUL|nr:LptF/LptG family permease [Caulobacter hibisci]MBI1683852.1 LptF/LptG family permease [Caulobacter hibisci]